jgi:hypothetical protein
MDRSPQRKQGLGDSSLLAGAAGFNQMREAQKRKAGDAIAGFFRSIEVA